MQKIRVWDLPTRVFHWLLFLGVLVALITGDEGEEGVLSIHQLFGFLVMALLVFRLGWGLVGTRHVRFASFVRGPTTVVTYVRALLRLSPPASLGHNPLGAWMIVVILLDLMVVVGTGLFAGGGGEHGEAGEAIEGGPLAHLVSPGTADLLSGVHEVFANLLIALIVVHVLGVLVDWLLTGDNLVRAMITGEKRLKPGFDAAQAIRSSRLYVAIPLALAAIGITCYIVLGV
jgi:cytochrome b